jgi:Lamin Tail Domain
MATRRWILICALVAAACAGVALAEAGIPGPDGVINACRKIEGGRLRAVASISQCRVTERPLKWNVHGPAGPAGPVGATGATGPQGPVGPQGPPGPGIESFDDLEGLACLLGANSGTIAIDYDAGTGNAHIRCVVSAGPSELVRINEFSTGVEGALTDEFVEIVNPGSAAVDLSGWKLVYRSAAGTSDVSLGTLPDGTTLAAGAFFLFGGSGYAGVHPADRSFSTSIASAGGGVGLRDPDGILVDSVAWGTATNALLEGTVAVAPTIAPAPGKSDARHPDGQDTNDNSADFAEDDPTPGGAN